MGEALAKGDKLFHESRVGFLMKAEIISKGLKSQTCPLSVPKDNWLSLTPESQI